MTTADALCEPIAIANDASLPDLTAVRRIADELTQRDRWTRERLVAFQRQRARETLRYAVAKSPYYRETIGAAVARGATLEELPILTKSILMARFDSIVTDNRLRIADIEQHLKGDRAGDLLLGQYRACASGGTSGERAVIVYDADRWELAAANAMRFFRMLGVPPDSRVLGIGAPNPLHISYRVFSELHARRPGTPQLSVITPLPEVVSSLNDFQPEVLITYPSFMRQLVDEQNEGRLRISPLRICSIAEALHQDVRNLVRQTWGIGVVNGFGTTETGMRGMECEHLSGIHLPEDLIAYEIVDESNHRVAPGVAGSKILITALTNTVLPLIRYELSDAVIVDDSPCACGRPYARIAAIEGRREELLRLPRRGGGQVPLYAARLWLPLVGIPGIRQFQVSFASEQLLVEISVHPEAQVARIKAEVEQGVRSALERSDVDLASVRVKLVEFIERAGIAAKERLVPRPR